MTQFGRGRSSPLDDGKNGIRIGGDGSSDDAIDQNTPRDRLYIRIFDNNFDRDRRDIWRQLGAQIDGGDDVVGEFAWLRPKCNRGKCLHELFRVRRGDIGNAVDCDRPGDFLTRSGKSRRREKSRGAQNERGDSECGPSEGRFRDPVKISAKDLHEAS